MEEGMIKRKPDTLRVDGKNETKPTTIDGCIDFTISNAGNETIFYGFSRDEEPNIPIAPQESSTWPLYRPCEVWDGELFIRFGNNGSVALILKTV